MSFIYLFLTVVLVDIIVSLVFNVKYIKLHFGVSKIQDKQLT